MDADGFGGMDADGGVVGPSDFAGYGDYGDAADFGGDSGDGTGVAAIDWADGFEHHNSCVPDAHAVCSDAFEIRDGSPSRPDAGSCAEIVNHGRHCHVQVGFGPHTSCDLKTDFERLAFEHKWVSLYHKRVELEPENSLEPKIVPRQSKLPGGWYPGATGWTRRWTSFWQVSEPPETGFLSWLHGGDPYKDWRESRTYLKVKGWIWYFAEIGAFQSVVEFEILSLPVWAGAERGGFVEDGAGIKRHRQAAERLGSSIVHHLRQRQADGRTRRLHALKQQELYCSTTRTDCRAAGRLTGRSGADLGNIIPGMGTPVPDCSKLVELVPIVDPDYQEGGLRRAGSQGHSPPQGAGTDPKPERQFDPTHDPYFDSSAGDIAAAGQSSGAQVDDCQYEE